VSALLAFGGSSAASLEVQQAGLAAAVVATVTSGRDSPVLDLSPTGALCGVVCGSLLVCWRRHWMLGDNFLFEGYGLDLRGFALALNHVRIV
jgi:hypothetical protein